MYRRVHERALARFALVCSVRFEYVPKSKVRFSGGPVPSWEINMKVSKFTLWEPDSDREMNSDIELVVDNPTKLDVQRVEYSVVLLGKSGAPVAGGSNQQEDCMIEPGEHAVISTGAGRVSAHIVGEDRDNVKLRANATLYAREFHRLGEIDAPAKDNTAACLKKSIKSALVEGKLVLAVLRPAADERGNVSLQIRMQLQSRCDIVLQDVMLKYRLLDRDGSEAESSYGTLQLRAKGSAIFDEYIAVKKSRLRGATLSFELLLFYPIHVANCEGISAPHED
jgi:hypothetical protein